MNIPPGFAQINVFLSGAALPRGAQIVFGVDNTGDEDSAFGVANAASNAVVEHLVPVWTDLGIVARVKSKLGPNDTGPEGNVFPGADGGDTYEPTPPQVSLIVNKVTGTGGRHGRGRIFWPCINEAGVGAAGIVGNATITVWQEAFNDFFNHLITDNLPMVLLHNAVEIVPTPVTGLSVLGLVATQRRRLRKVGGRKKPVPVP